MKKVRLIGLMGLAFLACSQAYHESSETENLIEGSSNLIVEGYFEYVGSSEKWAGPQTFLIHLSTLEAQGPVVSVTPPLVKSLPNSTHISKLTVDEIRSHLARLKVAMKGSSSSKVKCLQPLRVKLVQANGELFERESCWGAKGWPQMVSKITYEVMEDIIHSN